MAAALKAEGRDPEVVYHEHWHGFVHQHGWINIQLKFCRFPADCTAN
jgi:hypothetical protein